jgi:uncharacterized NAD(P)/FAD-binding protein YdhS
MSRRVVIAGGGFSGAATAAALLRRCEPGLHVTLVERSGVFGRGVAYGTPRPEHLLNVAAGKMSALPDEPGHFLAWARDAGHAVGEHDFVPRALYGDYAQAVLAEAERAAPAGTIERITGEVTAIAPRPAGEDGPGPRARPDGGRSGALVSVGGRRLEADGVVLALGVSRPAQPPFAAPVADHPSYVADPWDAERVGALAGHRSVLVLGTGMTMVDVALTLGGGPAITAVSRNGELPRAHRIGTAAEVPGPVVEPRPGLTADGLAAAVEAAAREAGDDWRGVVDSLRPVTPALWRSLAPREQARFARRHARRWEVHRSRTAPAVAARIAELRAAGMLRVEAAEVRSLRPADGDRIACEVAGPRTLIADAVVNAAGPAWDCRRGEHALLRDLIARGLAAPGPLGLGLRTAGDGALIDAAGRASGVLFTLGALRRGELWESVAVPELAAQACALAERLAAPASAVAA